MRFAYVVKKPLPDKLKLVGLQELSDTFAATFGVEAPDVTGLEWLRALAAFREFSASCMEAALASASYAQAKRADLERRARALGSKVRRLLAPRDSELAELVRILYAAIEIDVSGNIPGELRFTRCYFCARYTPELCAFMSAFDNGFVSGLCGGGELVFKTRMSEGAPCCRATLA